MKRSLLFSAIIAICLIAVESGIFAQGQNDGSELTIARLRYGGGGDWYWGRSSALPNLHDFLEKNTSIPTANIEVNLQATDPELYNYPILFLTGHGNINFSDAEAQALRHYLTNGGFLLANDSYGLAPAFRREMKKVFPSKELVELPFKHEIYHTFYDFPYGLPKIHEHDNKPPQGFGIFWEDRLVVFFAYESDIGDGWEDYEVHEDPPEKREAALKMGANIVYYVMKH